MQLKSPSKAGSATPPCQLHLSVSFYLMHNLMWLPAYLHVTKAFRAAPGVPRVKSQVIAKLIQLPADREGGGTPLPWLPGLCTPGPSLAPRSQGRAGWLPRQQGRGGVAAPFHACSRWDMTPAQRSQRAVPHTTAVRVDQQLMSWREQITETGRKQLAWHNCESTKNKHW